MACSGDNSIMCGGSWRNSVYEITGEVDLDVLQTAVTYAYVGCYVDDSGRDLGAVQNNMGQQASPRLCAELCVGYTYYGLQAAEQCFCDNDYGSLGPASSEDECNTDCAGHAAGGSTHAKCGGSWRNSVYHITAAQDLADVISGGADETFNYLGCYVDAETRTMNSGNDANGNEEGSFGSLGALATPHMCGLFAVSRRRTCHGTVLGPCSA